MRLPERLCVVAAHPDDDAIGCGGLIAATARARHACLVIYISDGSMSHVKSVRYPPPLLAAIREREATASLAVLGVTNAPRFLRLPDGRLASLDPASEATAIAALAAELASFRPEMIVAPWIRDPHPDHIAAARLTRAAVAGLDRTVPVGGYDVWLSIRGLPDDYPAPGEARCERFALDAELRDRKRRAILEHRSQTGELIDDDPDGFVIGSALLTLWLGDEERFYFLTGHA